MQAVQMLDLKLGQKEIGGLVKYEQITETARFRWS